MRHSVFWKIILGLTIVLTLAETGVLIFLYQYTYDHTIKDSTEDIKFAASSSALALETYDPDDLNDFIGCEDYLNGVCSGLGITYLYVLKPDIETKDELYLARGWGGNASEEYINHRYSGYLAKGVLRDEQIRVMNGEECVVIHEKNEYDDTLICYTPVKKHWSKAKQTTVNEIKSMVCAEISIKSVLANFNQKYLNLAATIVGATIVILILTGIVLYFRVSKPLKRISGRMKNFVSQKGAFFEKLPVKETIKNHTYARTTADITRLLRQIIEAGFTVSTTYNGPLSVPGFTFVVNELLTPPSSDAETLFARFLAELGHFSDLGAKTYTEMQMTGKSLTITYFIPVTSFSVIKSQIDDLLKYLKTEENDFTRDTFEMMFEDGLKTNYNNIEDEIRFYCNK